MYDIVRVMRTIQDNLTEDLLKPEYRGHQNKFYGHCYVASEALYHLTGKTLKPMYAKDHKGITHWWLEDNEHYIFDVTSRQYTDEGLTPPYSKGKRAGFLTKLPSKRAQTLINRI